MTKKQRKYKAKELQNIRRIDRLGTSITLQKAQKMCMDKRRFISKNEARDFALRGEARFQSGEMGSYKCQLCGGFHLTTVTAAIWKSAGK